jgi:hypothetical protein
MTRDEAIATLRDGLKNLPFGARRADAFAAFDRLVLDVHLDTTESFVREAYQALVSAMPELKPAADKLLMDWLQSTRPPRLRYPDESPR